MKRTRLFLLAAMAVFVFGIGSNALAQSGTCGANLTWTLSNGTLTISGTGAMTNWSYSSSVPWYSYRSYITILVIGESVTSIGDRAFFQCGGLTSLTIPSSVTSIGNYAFNSCSGLTGTLTIPSSVTSIGNYAFAGCGGLTSTLTIPDSVTSIGDGAFGGCKFTDIINNSASFKFASVTSVGMAKVLLPTSHSSDDFDYASDQTVGCLAAGQLTIPDTVTSIGFQAFMGCSGLTGTLTIPNSVTSIGDYAFAGCGGLTGTLTIPNSITSIGVAAFQNCGFTGTLTIPNSVTSIGDYAFAGCGGFTGTLTIPNSITSIEIETFRNCIGLTSVIIPNSVTSIGVAAFSGCSGLTSVTIGNSVTSIGNYAFFDCSGFTEITSLAVTPPTLDSDCFFFVPTAIPVHVPCESEAAYQSASGWSDFINYTDCIGNGLNDIGTTDFAIYPNPAKDKITIDCGENINSIEIVDLLGKVVYQGKETTIDVSTFAKGNYFVRIYTNNGSITKKVIVE
ncbi:MAG: leucine-rich repeat protein [Bacteroidales bacterium]|nr:leucine-rich repeat protein [Bacteroidales bacterium]